MDDFRPDDATRAQIGAADPAGSVWLAANAGSGKTRVLTDRVARLLLDGTPPERILCLTYTKAAAGEMQNRLFARLGGWAMLDEDALRAEITRLGVPRATISTERLRLARTLFARAIETPGGLKVQTIHAFCAALLRRFPLEAGVSPAFQEMDEMATARLHAEVLDDMAADPDFAPLVDAVAAELTSPEPGALLARIDAHRDALREGLDAAALRAALGIEDESSEAVRAGWPSADELDLLETIHDALGPATGKSMSDLRAGLRQALMADPDTRWTLLTELLLTKALEPRKLRASKERDALLGDHLDDYAELAAALAGAHARIGAFDALRRTMALHAFAPAFLAEVEARKARAGLLDFDDLIGRARRLLARSEMAQWVLFRLDGGLDHILVDEAQDTSPEQWDVIRVLAREFGAGEGARPDIARTLFVVGDLKQSIYRFQGADPEAFDRMRDVFARDLSASAAPLSTHALRHSFRSSPTILSLVDATFAGGGGLGTPPEHIAFNERLPGRVDLWDPVPKPEAPAGRVWSDPVDAPAGNDENVVLADRTARAIERMIADRVPVGPAHARRPVRAGDILILLRSRGALFGHIVRACKARGLDLAGADRLKLTDDLAVRDLVCALTWAATPEDDLSLATLLRSPLCGLSEADLFDLAHDRAPATLWSRVRDLAPPAVVAMLRDLIRVADILRPYEILQRILVRHDGRRLLLGRLGDESAEAIDALLGRALAYERIETPSLTGFLGWFAAADPELKRQGGAGSIRVMSIHGSKGLESPVVILPDTAKKKARGVDGLIALDDGTVAWMPPKSGWSPAMEARAEATIAADAEEDDRLLYVAMTRAENWLIVGAAGETGEAPEDSWYARIHGALHDLAPPDALEEPEGATLRLQSGDWSPAPAPDAPPRTAARAALPGWAETPVAPPPAAARRLSPSDLPGAKSLPGEASDALSAEAAMRRGTAIHALLERLSPLPPEARAAAAPHVLARQGGLLPSDDSGAMVAEALAILSDPSLAWIFAPDGLSEVAFALPAAAPRPPVSGILDRVLVTPDRIHVVDFKTNAVIPDRAEDVPEGLLRQMGAYAEAAAAIWPGREVALSILWTRTRTVTDLPTPLAARAWAATEIARIDPPEAALPT